MFRTIFLKTLFEKRWMTCWWLLSNVALVLFIVLFFPTLSESFGQSLKNVPESMQSLIGNAEDYRTLAGYLTVQVFQQMIFLTVTLAVIVYTGVLGGDENEGTLQTLLTHPISRGKAYWHKLLAASVITAVVTAGMFLASWGGALLIDRPLDVWQLAQATFMAGVVSMAIGLLGYMIAAITGKRALAASVAGVYAFLMYIISSLVESAKSLQAIEYLSPFHWYDHPSPLKGAFDFGDLAILVGASVVFAIVGYLVFIKRDIYQR
jgi:ABC-2 type transport system permease protein